MRTYKTKKGYFYKEYKNGQKKRISKEEHQKLKKDTKKTVTKKNKYRKKIKQRGGSDPLTTRILYDKLKKIPEYTSVVNNLLQDHRTDEWWDSKCKGRKTLKGLSCKKCKKSKLMKGLYQCSYCGYKYHDDSDCNTKFWKKFPLKSTKGGARHDKGNVNEKTDVCGNCFRFLTAATEFIDTVKNVLSKDNKRILNGTFPGRPPAPPERILNTYNTIERGDTVKILTNRKSIQDKGKIGRVLEVYHQNTPPKVKVECERTNQGGISRNQLYYKIEEVELSLKKD